jgi:L,D-transpeptidase ErfK/SrfK
MLLKIIISAFIIMSLIYPSFSYSKTYGASLCKEDGFTCLKIKRGESWQSLWPDDHERDIVMRVNRLNIKLYPGQVIAVPDNLSGATVMDFSPFPRQISSSSKLLVFDPKVQAWGAYNDEGTLVRWGPAAGGSSWCQDIRRSCRTSAGQFKVYSLGSSACYSRKFPLPRGGAPMPYCMFFNKGQALHGSSNLPGYNASHGCVRLYVSDAEWLRYDFVTHGTRVIVRPY